MDGQDSRKRISGAIMRLRSQAPFFAVLAMHADYIEDPSIPTAATNGRNIYYNPEFFARLSREELLGVLLHEVLHCAFTHIPRRGRRDPLKWNYACDYVINPMVKELNGAKLPKGALLDAKYEGRRVEEVYDMLPDPPKMKVQLPPEWFDLRPDLDPQDGDGQGDGDGGDQPDGEASGSRQDSKQGQGGGKPVDAEAMSRYWRNAVNGAVQAQKIAKGQGSLPKGVELLVEELNEPEVNWRELLWEYTVNHPHDFGEFDLRHIGRGIYEEGLEGQSLEIHIAIDTSGSCVGWVTPFLSELNGILEAFPHVRASLSYVDAALIGPFEVESLTDVPAPKGGGGTSFVPFFEHIEKDADPFGNHVLLYLTDGYGTFPDNAPDQDTIWVVTPGGLDSKQFPFGKTIRLQEDI